MSKFPELVQRHFDFLIQTGYAIELLSDQRVRYVSSNARIELFYSRGEVDVILDQNPPKHSFQFRLFLMAFHPDEEKRLGECINSSEAGTDIILGNLSRILRRCGLQLIAGDLSLFEYMATVKWWELPGYGMKFKSPKSSAVKIDDSFRER
jgi:hypothetical protein